MIPRGQGLDKGTQPGPLCEAADAKGTAPMPNEPAGDPGHRGSKTASPGSVDGRHLLLVGAGPGLGVAVARRFATGGYRVTLVARSTAGLGDSPGTLAVHG